MRNGISAMLAGMEPACKRLRARIRCLLNKLERFDRKWACCASHLLHTAHKTPTDLAAPLYPGYEAPDDCRATIREDPAAAKAVVLNHNDENGLVCSWSSIKTCLEIMLMP